MLVFIQAYIFFPTFILAITNPWCLIMSGTLSTSKKSGGSTVNRVSTVKTISVVHSNRSAWPLYRIGWRLRIKYRNEIIIGDLFILESDLMLGLHVPCFIRKSVYTSIWYWSNSVIVNGRWRHVEREESVKSCFIETFFIGVGGGNESSWMEAPS